MQDTRTIGDRLPDALLRIGRFLGSDAALKISRDFVADIMALHAAASAPSSPATAPQLSSQCKTLCKLVALDWDERTITLEWPDGVPSLCASAVSLEVDLSPLIDGHP